MNRGIILRILQITPQSPSKNSGGGLGVLQTANSMFEQGYNVDYIGPEITDRTIFERYNECVFLEPSKNKLLQVYDLLRGITNTRYRDFKQLNIDFEKYDAIVLDFTKLDYVLDRIGEKKLIVKVHNVEYDYAKKDFLVNHSLRKLLIFLFSKKQEEKILKRADHIFALTESDKVRLASLYGEGIQEKISINPVCLYPKENTVKKKGEVLNILITGSLWFGENANGVEWFIRNVFSNISFPVKLVVAGANPNEKLRSLIEKYDNIELIDTPESMDQYFNDCDVVVAPVFNGAGMKVKVAEALSYGRPVVCTKHAAIGYKIENGVNSFIVDDEKDFTGVLNKIYKLSNDEWQKIKNDAFMLYKSNYSITVSAKQWAEELERS